VADPGTVNSFTKNSPGSQRAIAGFAAHDPASEVAKTPDNLFVLLRPMANRVPDVWRELWRLGSAKQGQRNG